MTETMTETRTVDVLPERSRADRAWEWAERQGMEREVYYALAEPWERDRTVRVLYALLNSKITTRAQIMELGVDGLSRVRNLGTKGIAFIRQRLNEAANMNGENQSTGPEYADPTPEMLASPEFEAVWQAIKGWDISREQPANGHRMYAGATGTDVRIILDALQKVPAPA